MANSRKAAAADSVIAHLREAAAAALHRELGTRESVTLGLSGGVDSVVLLDILRHILPSPGIALRALHVHHGLSPHANRWEQFCREHCRRRGVPFDAVRVQIAAKGRNIEAQARAARYAAFAATGTAAIALAHHQDDQAETVLLRLLRGSGPQGLSAMAVGRPLERRAGSDGQGHHSIAMVIRPLLAVTRREILEYARARRLHWVEDDSNADEQYLRNFLRMRVLPLIETRVAGARAALARSGGLLAEAAELLAELARQDAAVGVTDGRIDVAHLRALGPARAANLLRGLLAARGEAAQSALATREMVWQLCEARPEAMPEIRLPGTHLRRFRNWIELVDAESQALSDTPVLWDGETRLALPGGGELRARKRRGEGASLARLARDTVTVRRRRGGERLRPQAGRPQRTLKNLLREAGISPWRRERMPLLYCGETLVWVPGVGVAAEYVAGPGESAVSFTWVEPDSGVKVD